MTEVDCRRLTEEQKQGVGFDGLIPSCFVCGEVADWVAIAYEPRHVAMTYDRFACDRDRHLEITVADWLTVTYEFDDDR